MKGLALVERVALVSIVLVTINGIGQTMVTYGGPVTDAEMLEDLTRSVVWHGGVVIVLAVLLLLASFLRGIKRD